jgi:hypothetical protein
MEGSGTPRFLLGTARVSARPPEVPLRLSRTTFTLAKRRDCAARVSDRGRGLAGKLDGDGERRYRVAGRARRPAPEPSAVYGGLPWALAAWWFSSGYSAWERRQSEHDAATIASAVGATARRPSREMTAPAIGRRVASSVTIPSMRAPAPSSRPCWRSSPALRGGSRRRGTLHFVVRRESGGTAASNLLLEKATLGIGADVQIAVRDVASGPR